MACLIGINEKLGLERDIFGLSHRNKGEIWLGEGHTMYLVCLRSKREIWLGEGHIWLVS